MKKLMITFLLAFLAACTAPKMRYQAEYDTVISKAQMNGADVSQGIKSESQAIYEDTLIRFRFEPYTYGLALLAENVSQQTLSLLWAEGAIIDRTEQSLRLTYAGANPQNKTMPIPSNTLPAGASFKMQLIPYTGVDSVLEDGHQILDVPELMPKLAFRADEKHLPDLQSIVDSVKNTDLFSALLVIKVGEERREYRFWYRINGTRIKEIE